MKTQTPPAITPLEMTEADIELAERAAKRIGFTQTAYTSTSGLWGLFCLPERPNTVSELRCHKCQDRPGFDGLGRPCKHCRGSGWIRRPMPKAQTKGGCFIKTQEFGLLFVSDLEDLQLHDLANKEHQQQPVALQVGAL